MTPRMTSSMYSSRDSDRRDLGSSSIIGGGATGLGAAVDAVDRAVIGPSCSKRTISPREPRVVARSSFTVVFDYLAQGDVGLVREALRDVGDYSEMPLILCTTEHFSSRRIVGGRSLITASV